MEVYNIMYNNNKQWLVGNTHYVDLWSDRFSLAGGGRDGVCAPLWWALISLGREGMQGGGWRGGASQPEGVGWERRRAPPARSIAARHPTAAPTRCEEVGGVEGEGEVVVTHPPSPVVPRTLHYWTGYRCNADISPLLICIHWAIWKANVLFNYVG